MSLHILPGHSNILRTQLLVVAFLGDGAYGAAVNTFTAGPLRIIETIGMMIGIWSLAGRNIHVGYNRSCPHSFASRSD